MEENLNKEENVDEKKIPKKTIRDSLYKNIDVSVSYMDKVISILMILLFLSIFIALLSK
ncbi:hypothetical protein [uncultured Clostridium sp.]|uniref:hypothetical protein n=1 Tax=uncultured Clostridium sp. TaxID=59620 RepID=UPI002629A089|nr:hypothetical protein [uncultured Clostridium sp.]